MNFVGYAKPGYVQDYTFDDFKGNTEVSIIFETGGLLKPDQVARILMRGIMKNKFYIHPGQSRLLWSITRYFPNLAHIIMIGEYKKGEKETGGPEIIK